MDRRNNRRRRFVIEREFQYRLTLRICMIASLVFLVFCGALLFIMRVNYEALVQNALLQMPEMVPQLQRDFRLSLTAIVSMLILMVSVIFGVGLILTQRLAGPLYALRRQLHGFSRGQRGVRLSLRSGDDFLPLAESFNQAMETHDKRMSLLTREAENALNDLRSQDPSAALHHMKEIVDALAVEKSAAQS